MNRLLLYVAFLATSAFTADHNLYRRCNRIPFCNSFRHQSLSSDAQFRADIANLDQSLNNIIQIPLANSQGNKLKLQLSLLKNSKARAKIVEEDHKRYEIADVLVSEPETVSYKISDKNDESVTITSSDDSTVKIVVNRGAPFVVEFYKSGSEPEVVFDGRRLVLENNSTSTAFQFDVQFIGSQALYGLHDRAMKLVLPNTADGSMDPLRLRNSDAAGYEVGDPMGLYGSVPVVYGHGVERTSGIFLHNAAQQWIDIDYSVASKPSTHFMVEDGTLDLFIMLGPTAKEVVRQYTDLTGKAHLPQLWALGYHQSRYSYQSQDDVKEVVTKMLENNFPMDAIWLDVDYADAKKYFTWNPSTYSDPVGMQNFIASKNKKLVTIMDPHIKVEDNYHVYEGAKGKYFVKKPDGEDFQGDCWPGRSSFIDFLDPAAREFWASLYSFEKFNGSTKTLAGTWNDMNEPAVFNAYDDENSLPANSLHYGNVQHKSIHNMYGFLQTKASHEAFLKRDENKLRPFVLTRSHFAGSQRYAAKWTGDNRAQWEYLASSYSECLLSNVLGHVFCGADIGGFDWNPPDILIQRWYQAANWLVFYRSHSNNNVNRREPYLFYDSMRDNIRKSMQIRYKYIPVIYTLFFNHVKTGDPISRPLFYEYPEMFGFDDHVLVGSDILATPVMKEVYDVEVHFPGNSSFKWFRTDLDGNWAVYSGGSVVSVHADLNTSPVFHKSGSIIPLWNEIKGSTSEMQTEPYTVYVNLDSNGYAEGYLYGDDYGSFEYESGHYYLLKLTYSNNNLKVEQVEGDMSSPAKVEKVIVHSVSSIDSTVCDSQEYSSSADGTPLVEVDIGHLVSNDIGGRHLVLTL